MITKKRLHKYISEIDSLISISSVNTLNWYAEDPATLLTKMVLRLGFKPKLVPNLQFYSVAKESTNSLLDLDNCTLHMAYLNDLKNIRAMLEGIYYNTWRYNLRGLDKIVSEVLSYGSDLLLKGKQ